MSVITIDNFDSYSDGDLNGQGGWSGNTVMQVQGVVVEQGTKAVAGLDNSGTDLLITKSISAQTKGIFSVWMRDTSAATGTACQFRLLDGTTFVALVEFRPAGAIQIAVGANSPDVLSASYSANTWFQLEIEIDQAGSQCRGRYNGGTWSTFRSVSFTSITNVRINGAGDNTGTTVYYDNITFDNEINGPTNVKTWDGVTQSTGIKTYQGVAVANVKTWNGIT